MKNFFADPNRYDLAELIDHILTTQVKISWQKEVAELERCGLEEAAKVLDIGTGTGLFLCLMAQRYPEKFFTGIETSERLIDRANQNAKEMGLTNVKFILGQCPLTDLKEKFDFVFARLAIYCTPEPDKVLAWAYDRLEKNGRIAIIELDYDWIYAYPPAPIIQKMFSFHRKEFESHGADCSMGKKLPAKLLQAGFRDLTFGVRTWWSSYELTGEQFFDLFSNYGAFSFKISPDIFTKSDYDYFIAYLRKVIASKSDTVAYPKVIASGLK